MWTLSSAPTWEIEAENRSVECYNNNYYYFYYYIIIIIIVVVVVDDDTYYWVYLYSDHTFQVYYKERQFFYKVR